LPEASIRCRRFGFAVARAAFSTCQMTADALAELYNN